MVLDYFDSFKKLLNFTQTLINFYDHINMIERESYDKMQKDDH